MGRLDFPIGKFRDTKMHLTPERVLQQKDVLDEAGIVVNPSNRKEIDQAFHQIVGVTYKDCPTTWKRLKQELTGDEQRRRDIIQKLQSAIH